MAGMGEGGLREEAARLRTELEVERRANVESEDFLRRKWHRLQADIDEWSSRYEADLERNEQELERLNQERATDLIRLSSLQAAYEADVADKRAREQEMRAQVRSPPAPREYRRCAHRSRADPAPPRARRRRRRVHRASSCSARATRPRSSRRAGAGGARATR